jgi:hypothetical protein
MLRIMVIVVSVDRTWDLVLRGGECKDDERERSLLRAAALNRLVIGGLQGDHRRVLVLRFVLVGGGDISLVSSLNVVTILLVPEAKLGCTCNFEY